MPGRSPSQSRNASYCSHETFRMRAWLHCVPARVTVDMRITPGRRLSGLDLQSPRFAPLEGGGDEVAEQRMGPGRLALELGVELHGQEPGVIGQLDDLHELAVRAGAGHGEAVLLERLAIAVVELVAMAVPLADLFLAVGRERAAGGVEPARPSSKSHRAAALADAELLFHERDHGVLGVLVELRRIGIVEVQHAPRELDRGALHAEADPEEGNPLIP